MKRLLPFMLLLLANQSHSSDNGINVTTGIGLQYTGIGVGVASRYSADSQFHSSVGCMKVFIFNNSVIDSSCGFGAGWSTSSPFDSKKHSIGVHAALLRNQHNFFAESDSTELTGGLFYTYHLNGFGKDGLSFNLSAQLNSDVHDSTLAWGFGIGYQF